jgi:hypothetical protein
MEMKEEKNCCFSGYPDCKFDGENRRHQQYLRAESPTGALLGATEVNPRGLPIGIGNRSTYNVLIFQPPKQWEPWRSKSGS